MHAAYFNALLADLQLSSLSGKSLQSVKQWLINIFYNPVMTMTVEQLHVYGNYGHPLYAAENPASFVPPEREIREIKIISNPTSRSNPFRQTIGLTLQRLLRVFDF